MTDAHAYCTRIAEDRVESTPKNTTERSLRNQLASLKADLAKYRSLFGDVFRARERGDAKGPVEVQELTDQLLKIQTRNDQAKAIEKEHQLAERELFQELEKLSTAWETLDKQVKSKVFDLEAMEEKMAKNNLEVCLPLLSLLTRLRYFSLL